MPLQCRRRRFDSWVGKTPWRRKWQHSCLAFLSGKSRGQRSLVGHSLWGHQGAGHGLAAKEEESRMGVDCISEPKCLLSIKNTPEILLLRVLFCRSVTTSCLALQLHGPQHARLPCPSPSPGVCWNSCPLNWWCHPTVSSSVTPSSPALRLAQHQGLFQWVGFSYQVAKVLELFVLVHL